MDRLLVWFWTRFRPREGWLLFSLTVIILASCVRSVSGAEWVPESQLVWVTFITALSVTYLLIWRTRIHPFIHGAILTGYITITAFLGLIEFRLGRWIGAGWPTFSQETQLSIVTLWARFSSWMATVGTEEPSGETVVFAAGLALAVGLAVSASIWHIYRRKQPLVVVFSLVLLVGLNNYFSGYQSPVFLLSIVLGVIYLVMWQQRNHELFWDENGIDYSADMRMATTFVTAGIVLVLVVAGIILPSLPYSKIAHSFQNSALVHRFEETFERVFSGVNTAANRGSSGIQGVSQSGSAPIGVLPRSYLLGNAPELAETSVFLAAVTFSQPPLGPLHWRSASYDIYTGRGWRQSQTEEVLLIESREELPQFTSVSNRSTQIKIEQSITWFADGRLSNLFSLGLPTGFRHPVQAHMRQFGDISHVNNPTELYQPGYQATSILNKRDPFLLNQLAIDPEQFDDLEFYNHYTSLPSNLPERVHVLADQVTAGAESPFEQAVLLEQFLRQYPYNLDIPAIPDDVDPVDYFLFDLQEGYCDLYASSMVVMARSLGLPARLGIGYLNPQPRPDGSYLITQDLGHSWAEIYFPEIGWVEFEPTATFPISPNQGEVAQAPSEAVAEASLPDLPENLPLPDSSQEQFILSPWIYVFVALFLGWMAFIGFNIVQRRNQPQSLAEIFAQLRLFANKVGYPADQSQTLTEFSAGLQQFLQQWVTHRYPKVNAHRLMRHISQLIVVYEQDLYSGVALSDTEVERSLGSWQLSNRLRRRLIWLKRKEDWGNYFYR